MRNILIKIYLKLIKLLENIWFKKLKLKNTIIICSHNDFDMNGNVFYNYLVDNGYLKKYKIVWLIKGKRPANLPRQVLTFREYEEGIIKSYYLCTAKIGTFDDYIPVKRRSEQKWIYLTHGSLSLKNTKGKLDIPPYVDYILFPSENISKQLASIYNIEYPSKRILYLGMLINDIFYSEKEQGHLNKITNVKYKKVLIWLPTFRKKIGSSRNDSNIHQIYGLPIISNENEIKELNTLLSSINMLLIIKYHPMQDISSIKHLTNLSNIIILNNESMKNKEIELYHLLKDTNAMITDYSSVAADYMHLNKPIAFTTDDIDSYNLGIIKDFIPLFNGDRILTFKDLCQFIENVNNDVDNYKEKRNISKNIIFKYSDKYSTKRLVEFIEKIL